MSSSADGEVAYNLRSRKVIVDRSNRSKKQRSRDQQDENVKPNGWCFPDVDADPWRNVRTPCKILQPVIIRLSDIQRQKQPCSASALESKPGEPLRNTCTPSVQQSVVGKQKQPSSASASSESAYSEPGEPYTWNAKGQQIMKEKGWKMTDEERWKYWSNKMLDHYNYWKDAKFRILKVIKVITDGGKIHSNFIATESDDASSELFFGELYVMPNEAEEYLVLGACVLKQVDSGPDLKAKRCSLCCDTGLIHPTAYYGYCSASGTPFSWLEEIY